MKKLMSEFKAFALRGNVINLAVGIIVGAAFQNVVTSLTENILSPVIGLFTGQNFDALQFKVLGVTVMYGAFITSVINFLIMAFVVFMLVRLMNKLVSFGRKPSDESPTVRECPFCMSEINIGAKRCPACTSQLEP